MIYETPIQTVLLVIIHINECISWCMWMTVCSNTILKIQVVFRGLW